MDALRCAAFVILSGLVICLCGLAQAPIQPPPQTSSQDGLQLLHKMQAALGGAEKITAIHDYEETVRAQIWNNDGTPMGEVRKRTRWMRSPNLLRLDQIGPRDTYVLYFDGGSESGWEMLPDLKNTDKFKTTGEAIELVSGELNFAKSYLSGFTFNMWLADRIPDYTVTSPAPNVLRIGHDSTASDITLDPPLGCQSNQLASRWPTPTIRFQPKCVLKDGPKSRGFNSPQSEPTITAVSNWPRRLTRKSSASTRALHDRNSQQSLPTSLRIYADGSFYLIDIVPRC
jgi:hypothetical protein